MGVSLAGLVFWRAAMRGERRSWTGGLRWFVKKKVSLAGLVFWSAAMREERRSWTGGWLVVGTVGVTVL